MISPDERSRPVPVDGLDRALAEGRRRRRMALGTGGGGLAVVALVAVLTANGSGTGGPDSLQVIDPPTAISTPTPAAAVAPTPTATPGTTAAPEFTEDPEPDCVNNDCDEGEDSAVRPSPSSPSQRRASYREAPTRSVGRGCSGVATTRYGTCGSWTQDKDSIVPGEPVTITRRLCMAPGATTSYDLGFASGQEQELEITDGTRTVWTFSATVVYEQGEHHIGLLPQECLAWRLSWDGTDGSGERVRPGVYQLSHRLTVDTANGEPVSRNGIDGINASFDSQITVTS